MKAGQIFTISYGAYSDYMVIGVFRAEKDFSVKDALEQYLTEFPKQREMYKANEYEFVGWLSQHGFIADVDYTEVYLGGGGEFDIDEQEHRK